MPRPCPAPPGTGCLPPAGACGPGSGRRDTPPLHAAGCTGTPRIAGCRAAWLPCTLVSRVLGCGCSAPRYPSSTGLYSCSAAHVPQAAGCTVTPRPLSAGPGCLATHTAPPGCQNHSTLTDHAAPPAWHPHPPSVRVHDCASSCLHDVQLPLGCWGTGMCTSLRSCNVCACACSPQGSGTCTVISVGPAHPQGCRHMHTPPGWKEYAHTGMHVCVSGVGNRHVRWVLETQQTSQDGSPCIFFPPFFETGRAVVSSLREGSRLRAVQD